jgi:uncharacterized protein (TIGR02453 family)
MTEPHFTRASFRFQRELEAHNERPWFQDNKARYEAELRDPFLALIGALQKPLAAISPHYRADPRPSGGSLFRIYRDARFSNDKRPYKTHAGARLMHVRARERDCPSFYIHLQGAHCFVAAGIWHPQPDTLKRIRAFLADNPKAWLAATRSPAFRRRFELGGEVLTRPPRGFDPAHPLIEDLKRKSFVAWQHFSDADFCRADLPHVITPALRGLAPLVDYLCAALELEF